MKMFTQVIYYALFPLLTSIIGIYAFTGQQCLEAHNRLRSKHSKTEPLKYSKELEKEAQAYADLLAKNDGDQADALPTPNLPKKRRRNIPATTDPFFHKELWDGEILFPPSKWDLNKNRKGRIGESIHKFCCYSFPYCPSEFFHGLNFPPSAKGVVGHFYKENKNYNYATGGKISETEEVKHFTNIVWKKTKELGCAQSKRSKKHCVYTVVRYRTQGSIGLEDAYKENVGAVAPPVADKKATQSGGSYLTAFLVVIFLVLILVVLIIAYIKRAQIKSLYAEYQIKRGAKRAEASLRDTNYDEESFRGSKYFRKKKSIIYKPSLKTRPSIHVVLNPPPANTHTLPLKPRDPTPAPVYANVAVMYNHSGESVTIVDNEPEKKLLPPRPTSPVKADSPALRPHSAAIPQQRNPPASQSLQRQSLPAAPTPHGPSSTATPIHPYQNITIPAEPSSGAIITNQSTEREAIVPKKPVAVPKKPESNTNSAGVPKPLPEPTKPLPESNKTSLPKAPIPAARPHPTSSNSTTAAVPTPAPRPNRPTAPSRPIQPGRASRASKKNPNFRTLPLNDRGSLRRPEKPADGKTVSWQNQPKMPSVAEESSSKPTTTKVPIAPPKKPKNNVSTDTKPLLHQTLAPVKEENARPLSVAEMRKLLEQNNQR